jgi:hypothetical protein
LDFLDGFDIPAEIAWGPHSPAFRQFLFHWFVDPRGLSRHEVDLAFLGDFTPSELETARELIRRNLHRRYDYLIEGAAALADMNAVPVLKEMLASEAALSRQLTISGALWNLTRDEVFVECLHRMKSAPGIVKQAHFHQILWLEDERAIDLLIGFLDDADGFVRFLALSNLNALEFKEHFLRPASQLPRQPESYRNRRNDPVLRAIMVANLRDMRPRGVYINRV